MNRKISIGFLAVTFFSFNTFASDTAQETLERVRSKYESIGNARIQFSQKVSLALSRIEQNLRGTLLLKKENKYRLEMDQQTIVTDGITVWSYSPSNKQVLIDDYKVDAKTLTPEKILGAAPEDYFATMLAGETLGGRDLKVVKLVPKSDDSFVQSLKLWIDDSEWLIRKAEIVDINEKKTQYVVEKIQINIGLKDSEFVYDVPSGVEIVDLR